MERRLFVAIALPRDVSDALEAEVDGLTNAFPFRSRVVPRENWHLTLLFIGETPEALIPKIESAIRRAVNGTREIVVDFDRICYGPPGRPPRMVWLTTTEKTSRALSALHLKLIEELRSAEVPGDAHGPFDRFAGHLTLARFDPGIRGKPLDRDFENGFVGHDVLLMESIPGRGGPAYRELSRVPLNDGAVSG